MHCVRQDHKTAKGIFSVLGLAVLILLTFCFCGEAGAVGLKIELLEKDRELVLFGQPESKIGLSLSSDSLPLLENKLKLTRKISIDYDQGFVDISETLGSYQISTPIFLTLSNYAHTQNWLKTEESWRKNLNTYFQGGAGKSKGIFEWEIPVKFPKVVSKIIGEGGPGLKVSGHRKISFSGKSTWQEGAVNTATSRQSKFPSLNMEQESQFTINGTIGSKISVRVDQDSKRHTDLENTLQLRYTGEEDEIIQTIEAGNTNLSVRSGLIGYGERVQGLFGIKTTAKIGSWDLTMITSQEKGSTQRAEFKAGAETQKEEIRDYQYLRRTFYHLGQDGLMNDGGYTHSITYQNEFFLGDSIVEIKLFKSNKFINDNSGQNLSPYGIAYVDPENEDTLISYKEVPPFRRFEEIDPEDYFVSRTEYWIQLYQSLQPLDILAAYYVILRDGRVDTVGYIKDSCSTSEDDTCMRLKLIKPETPNPENFTWEYEWKNVYYLMAKNIDKEGFKLDIYTGPLNGEDIQQDKNAQDSTLYLRIFGLDALDLFGDPKPDGDGIVDYRQIDFGWGYLIFPQRYPFSPPDGVSYTGNLADTLRERVNSIYSSNNNKDHTEESKYYIYVESATRKSDYRLGRAPIIEGSEVVTLNGRPLTKGQDYNIIYETGEIVFLTQEALSPTANLTVDYEYAPLLMIEKKNMFGIQAGYSLGSLKFGTIGIYKSEKTAEQRPRVGQEPVRNFVWGSNLEFNSTSVSFITRMINALPLVKTDALSSLKFKGQMAQSIPNPNTKNKAFIDDFEGSLEYTDLSIRRGVWTLSSPPEGKEHDARCKMWWYNPYHRVLITDIWPNKEVERTEDKTNVLTLQIFPDEPHRPSDSLFDTTQVSSRWNGIMRAFFAGAYDQTRTKFLEIWLKGEKGVLNIDLGEINEDIDADGVKDTEDRETNGQTDGLLDDDEDTGLDGVLDEDEPGYSQTLTDPSGDNWSYEHKTGADEEYAHINGTQGNREDPDRGRRPDTEDINSNNVLDVTNNYFQYSIDLGDPSSEFLADPEDTVGWRLYRIPLKEPGNYAEKGNPDWDYIRFARVWLSSSEPVKVQIASIQLVGNRWENLGISSSRQRALPIGQPPAGESEFDIFVINTHENLDYTPPSGVSGVLNRQTRVREKEQSLVLKYINLKPLHQGSAYRFLYNPEDYTNYRYLKMFVHGPEDSDSEKVVFFLRLGRDSTNFYEYHTQVLPGWEGNEVVIDFEKITALKAYALNNREPNSREPIDTTAGHYRVRGEPTLSRVRWFSMGVRNDDSLGFEAASGEIWVDELMVTEIRKEKGLAGDFRIDTKLADLCNLNFSFRKQDSEYRDLRKKKEGSNSLMKYDVNISGFKLDRFLPYSFGYSLPLSFTYSRSLTLPKWKTGSDIILPKELREKEKTENISKGINFNPSFTKSTKNWLLGLTLKKITTGFSYTTSSNTSLNKPVNKSSRYRMTGRYNLSGIKELSFAPLGWAKTSLLPKSLIQTRFSLLPTSLSFNGTVNRTKSHSVDNVGNVKETFTRDFTGSMNAQASPIKGIPITYTMSTSRDISDPQTIKFSFNPKNAKLGIERSFSETFKTSYKPQWFKFLTTNFSFDSKYNENSDRTDSYNQGGTRRITNSNTRRADITLNWQKLFGSGRKKGEKKGISLNPFKLLASLTKRIDPVGVKYQRTGKFTRSGLLSRPSLAYRWGFTDEPKVGRTGTSNSRDRVSFSDTYKANSGIRILGTKVRFAYIKTTDRVKTSTGDTKTTSTTFPDFDFGLRNLEKIWLLKKFVHSLSYNFDYSKKQDRSEKEKTGELLSEKTTERISHSATLSRNWKGGINTILNVKRDYRTEQSLKGVGRNRNATQNYKNSISLKSTYSFSAPHGIKIPFLRKIKFKSKLSLSLNTSITSSKQKRAVGGQDYVTIQDRSQLSVTATSGYSFSKQVTGGFKARWIDSNDKKTKRKMHTRELGIWLMLRF